MLVMLIFIQAMGRRIYGSSGQKDVRPCHTERIGFELHWEREQIPALEAWEPQEGLRFPPWAGQRLSLNTPRC